MYGQMGAASNTMMFQERPGDVNALLAQVKKKKRAKSRERGRRGGGTGRGVFSLNRALGSGPVWWLVLVDTG